MFLSKFMEKRVFRKPMFQSRITISFYNTKEHRSGQSSSIILTALATWASHLYLHLARCTYRKPMLYSGYFKVELEVVFSFFKFIFLLSLNLDWFSYHISIPVKFIIDFFFFDGNLSNLSTKIFYFFCPMHDI